MVSTNRTDVERTVTNVRDATDWADKLVQKLYANPFVLSPFYKPTPEDTRVQVVYDAAQVFTKGAQELNDSIKRLDAHASPARPLLPSSSKSSSSAVGFTPQLKSLPRLRNYSPSRSGRRPGAEHPPALSDPISGVFVKSAPFSVRY